MASSTLTFKDQFGNPVWGLATRIARGHKPSNEAEDERYPDRTGKTTFLEVKVVLPSTDGHIVHVNFNEGLNPDWKSYGLVSRYFSDIEDPDQLKQPIVVEKSGDTPPPDPNRCPVDYNKEQFTSWFNKIKLGSGPTIGNMQAMVPELTKCGMLWQNQGIYPPDQWRPRIHQAPILPNHDSDHNVDCGDFGGVWVLSFRY